MNIINFKLSGLTCAACAKLVTNRLKSMGGVEAVAIDPESGAVQVISQTELTLDNVAAGLVGTNYAIVK